MSHWITFYLSLFPNIWVPFHCHVFSINLDYFKNYSITRLNKNNGGPRGNGEGLEEKGGLSCTCIFDDGSNGSRDNLIYLEVPSSTPEINLIIL